MTTEPRFQSSLGTAKAEKVYREGYNIDRISLATVTAVHYRYNTVDVRLHGAGGSVNKGNASEGNMSARLPIGFGGRTAEGKPFGEVTPIEIGTLVLIGFVDGKKTTPIVLSVYGRPDESYELSRAPFSTGDTNNKDVHQLANQQFRVYPSLTYESIDGMGNRTVSFTGKSFMVTDADASPMGSGITDDGEGTSYEELDSSYYHSGELIEPEEGKAPVILFKHQGNKASTDKDKEYEEEDKHALMFFIDQDGTYRTSMVDEDADWRTYFELTPEGSLRFRAQNDSKSVGMGDDYNEFTIDQDGLGFRVGDKYLRITPNGTFGDLSLGGGIGGGGGGGLSPEELQEIRDGIQKVLDANLTIEKTNEQLKILADKIAEESDALVKYQAEFLITAEEIKTHLSETRIYEMIEDGLEGYDETVKQVAKDAVTSMDVIKGLSEDNILTPLEKQMLLVEWDMIKAEYPSYVHQADKEEVSSNKYTQAYNSLKAYVEPLLAEMDKANTISRLDFNVHFTNYFVARTELVGDIYDSLKFEIMEAARIAAEAGRSANTALGNSSLALYESNRDLKLLLDIVEDGVIGLGEKEEFEEIYDNIIETFLETLDQAQQHKVGTTHMQSLYQDLKGVVEDIYGILDDMDEDTEVNSNTVYNAFSDLYAEIQEVLRHLANQGLRELRNFRGDMEDFNTQITQTSQEIKAMASSVQLLGKEVTLSQAYISLQADRIDRRITVVEFERDLGDSDNPLFTAGKNLFIMATSTKGLLNPSTGVVESGEGIVSNFIKATQFSLYTATLFDNKVNNGIYIAFYNDAMQFISGDAISGTDEILRLIATTPRDTKYIRVGTRQPANVQLERGTGSNYYFVANEDVGLNVQTATDNMETRKEYYYDLEYQLRAAQAEGSQFLSILEDLMKDNLIEPDEKMVLRHELDKLTEEKDDIMATASAQEVVPTVYENAFTQLEIYLESNFLEDMEGNTVVVPNTMRTIFERFYNARDNLLTTLTGNAKTSYEASLEMLDEVTQGAADAEERARQLAELAESAARSVSYIEETIANAYTIEGRDIDLAEKITEDGKLTPDEILSIMPYVEEMKEERDWLIAQANTHNVSTSDYESSLNGLDAYFSQFTNPEALRKDSIEVNAQTFVDHFRNYHRAKLIMLDGILAGAKGEFEKIDVIAHAMRNEAKRRQEQMQGYLNAVKDSELAITRLEKKIEEVENNISYMTQITSTNGFTFKNRIINTTLEARIFRGTVDITEEIKPENFVWTKVKADGTEDEYWNNLHKGVGNKLSITHEDVDTRATFNVEIYDDVEEE